MNTVTIALLLIVAVALAAAIVMWLVRRRRDEYAAFGTAEAPPRPVSRWHRLADAKRGIGGRLGAVLRRSELDEAFWSDLEDCLVGADVGITTATDLIERVRASGPSNGAEAKAALREELLAILDGRSRDLTLRGLPSVILVVGVNGTGKTTTIGKLAHRLQGAGSKVMLGSADTFRAAADEQLRTWAERVGVGIVGGQAGADPASVAFDAYRSASANGCDALIVDTAGRLQTKSNLMDELSKVARVLQREAGDLDEVLLVLDGTTGQNAISQARLFQEAAGVTGITLTKLDGTSKGGVVIAVEQELKIPVKFVGLGEGLDDLVAFEPEPFVDALLAGGSDE